MKVQSPQARRSVYRSRADCCGMHPDCRFVQFSFFLSRRSARRHDAVAARAFIAVHYVGAASLLL